MSNIFCKISEYLFNVFHVCHIVYDMLHNVVPGSGTYLGSSCDDLSVSCGTSGFSVLEIQEQCQMC